MILCVSVEAKNDDTADITLWFEAFTWICQCKAVYLTHGAHGRKDQSNGKKNARFHLIETEKKSSVYVPSSSSEFLYLYTQGGGWS